MNNHDAWRLPLFVMILQTSAYAGSSIRQACPSEIKKFQCDAKSDSYAYACLHKHKEARVKDKGFSRACYAAYESYEKTSGRQEKVESHQIEQREHVN